jgi:alcohol dehydrogenase
MASIMSAVGAANAAGLNPGATVIVAPATDFFSSSAVAAALGLGAARVVVAGRREETLRAVAGHFSDSDFDFEEQMKGGGRIAVVALKGGGGDDDVEGDVAALRAATPRGEGADVFLDFASPESGPGYVLAGIRSLKRGGW